MNRYIDLHIHSTFSDGILSVKEIIRESIRSGAKYIAITDHDIIDGAIELMSRIKKYPGITGIPAVELCTVYRWNNQNVKIHLLGYNIDLSNDTFYTELLNKRMSRKEQNIAYVERMLFECNIHDKGIFNQIDFSKHVYIKKTIQSFYADKDVDLSVIEDYLKSNPIHYCEYDFNIEHAISMIHNVGGLTVLAHPYQTKLEPKCLERMVVNLRSMGLDGIETTYARANNQDNQFAKYMAQKYNLLETCGSDFHTYVYENYIASGKNKNLLIQECSLIDRLIKDGQI